MTNPRDVNVRVGLDPSKYEKGSERTTWATKQMLRQQEAAERKWRALQRAHAEALEMVERKERQVFQAHAAALRENQAREEAAARATADAQEKAQRAIQDGIDRTHKVMTATGTVMLTSGAAIAAGLALATRAAVSWESAWTGVMKTVDASPEQLERVEGGLRGLARTLPTTHQEIAATAEAAGQLGVSAGAITGFTKIMVDLGQTTNLTAEEAATSIAQMAAVMDPTMLKSGDGVSRFGATLVALGNDGASTEASILQMAQRISGAGALTGASSADVLALASALSSMGIEAELGGGVASRILTKMYSTVQSGGDSLNQFAKVAGMSAGEFADAFSRDPIAALGLMTDGLNRVEAEGGNVVGTLGDLGFKSTEDVRVLLQLKGSADLLTGSLKTANTAWEENSALLDEANKRYDTTEAKLQIAKNTLIDAAINIGETFLPVLSDTATSVADLVNGFAALPAPVQTAVGVLGALAATVGVAGGAFLVAYPRVVEMYGSMRELGVISEGAAGKLEKVGPAMQRAMKGAAVLAGGIAAVQVLDSIADSGERGALGVEQTLSALLSLNGTDTDAAFSGISSSVTDLNSALDILLGGGFDGWMERVGENTGNLVGISGQVGTAAAQFENIGLSLAQLVDSGRGAEAKQIFDDIAAAAEEQGYSVEQVNSLMPAYGEALAAVKNEQAGAAEAVANTTVTVQAQSEALQENFEAQMKASGQALSLRDAQRGMEAAYDDARKALDDNGKTLDTSTEKGRANQAALDGIASAGLDVVESMQANGASQKELRSAMEVTRDRFIKTARAMGASKTEARELADQLGLIPKDIRTSVSIAGAAAAQSAVNTLWSTLQNIDGKTVTAGVAIKQYGQAALATGGRVPGQLPGFPTGGRLPGSSPADPMEDNLLGVDEAGMPRVRVRSREYLMNEPAADYYGDGVMGALNARAIPREALAGLPGLAAGGGVASAQRDANKWRRELARARRELSGARDLSREAASEERRAQRTGTTRDDDDAARGVRRSARLEREAEARVERAEQRLEEAQARRSRLREERGDLGQSLRRGDLRAQATGSLSGAYSAIDQMFGLAFSGDLTRSQSKRLKETAKDAEQAMRGLYKQAEALEGKLASARDRTAELKQISDGVASGLSNEQSLGDAFTTTTNPWSGATSTSVTGKGMLSGAQATLSRVRSFASKLKELAKAGLAGPILQEIASMGTTAGMQAADALLADRSVIADLNATYKSIDYAAGQAGQGVTEGYAKGGLSAAQAIEQGLEKQVEAIDRRIDGWATRMGNAMAKALGLTTRAGGGPMVAGRPYLVGERGPELEVPGMSGYMLTASQTKYAMTQPTKTVNVSVVNHYPIGEPESVATNKALDRAAAVGV